MAHAGSCRKSGYKSWRVERKRQRRGRETPGEQRHVINAGIGTVPFSTAK